MLNINMKTIINSKIEFPDYLKNNLKPNNQEPIQNNQDKIILNKTTNIQNLIMHKI